MQLSYIEGYDFAADPHDATKQALRSVAMRGLGLLVNATDHDEFVAGMRPHLEDPSRPPNLLLNHTPGQIMPVLDEITRLTTNKSTMVIGNMQRNVSNQFYLHTDTEVSGAGVRLMAGVSGPDAALVVAEYDQMQSQTEGGLRYQPKPSEALLAAHYAPGNIVIMANSPNTSMHVLIDATSYEVEHRLHSGFVFGDKDQQRHLFLSQVVFSSLDGGRLDLNPDDIPHY